MKECPACHRCFADHFAHCPTDGDTLFQSLTGEPILDGRYQLESRLGQGGMGMVYKARHIFLKTQHAIKVVLPDLVGNDPSLVTRFRQEAMAAAAIRHPNIIAVTDFGVARGTMPFLVMEFVKGKSLQDLLSERGRLSAQQTFEIISAVCAGVGAAHRQGIVHRDLKPLNIMIQDALPTLDAVKVLDFGLAKIKSGELLGSFVQAQTTGLMGSPYYMAPEQWSDEEPDRRADVYSLGIIIYQMLAGDVPFKGASMPSIMKKHLTTAPPPFAALGLNVSPQVEQVVFRALEKDPAARPQSVEDLVRELREAMGLAPLDTQRSGGFATLDPMATNIMHQSPQATHDRLGGTVNAGGGGDATVREARNTAFSQSPADEAARRTDAGGGTQVPGAGGEHHGTEAFPKPGGRTEVIDPRVAGGTPGRELGSKTTTAGPPAGGQLAATNYSGSTPADSAPHFDSTTRQDRGVFAQTAGKFTAQQPGWQTNAATVIEAPPAEPGVVIPPAEPKKVSIPLMIGAGALAAAVLVGGGSFVAYRYLQPPTTTPTPVPVIPTPVAPTPAPKTVPEMVAIPGGTFQMGTNEAPPNPTSFDLNQMPARPVTVKSFMLQKTEVTNQAYLEFVQATKRRPPDDWVNNRPPAGHELLPVRNVSYEDAVSFAEWRSQQDNVKYRLPTEEEWEYAARGGGRYKLYPWGDDWVDGRANIDTSGPKIVGSYPQGANQWGILDLIGNVSEWTSSQASLYPGHDSRLRIPPEEQGRYVQRGGSYLSKARGERAINALRRGWSPSPAKNPSFGFRLARDAS